MSRTRGIPLFGPHAGELEPLSGPDILAAALETGTLALLTWDLRRVASPGRTMARLLQCVGPAVAVSLALAACVNRGPSTTVRRAVPAGIAPRACPGSRCRAGDRDAGRRCPRARRYEYRIAAINVEMTLNRFLDHDPKGRMYVEEELERVRQEEARNREARAGKGDRSFPAGFRATPSNP